MPYCVQRFGGRRSEQAEEGKNRRVRGEIFSGRGAGRFYDGRQNNSAV